MGDDDAGGVRVGHPVLLRTEDKQVVLGGADGEHLGAHVEDDEDGEAGAVGGCILGGLADVLGGGVGGDGLLPRDLELSGDAVVPGVEVTMTEGGAPFDWSFEGGVGKEGGVEVVVELAFGSRSASWPDPTRSSARRPWPSSTPIGP
jgi:hypothetical protein